MKIVVGHAGDTKAGKAATPSVGGMLVELCNGWFHHLLKECHRVIQEWVSPASRFRQ
jgi:hypothetical protein